MKAIVQRRYGRPENVLELRDIAKPDLGDDQVLVRVHAASMHPDVWHVVNGWPYALRLMGSGLLKPRQSVPGTDIAGRVEAVGKKTTRFQPGDEVFGEIVKGHQWKNAGAYAEYAAVRESALALKPENITFEQAAAVPTSGLIAFQGIHRDGQVQPGQNVLINGAGGAVGTFAVQIAKAAGAHVTAVDGTDKLDMLQSIGADLVIDYTKDDFTQDGERYDLILDIPGNRSFDDLKRVLGDDGRYVIIGHDNYGASGNRLFGGTIGRVLKLQLFAPFGRRPRDRDATTATEEPFAVLTQLIEAGQIMPVIDKTFPLSEVAQAIRYLEAGNAKGKIVIAI